MPHPEAAYLDFCPEQSRAIALASQTIADLGGPEAKGAAVEARAFADQLDKGLDEKQRSLLLRFNEGNVSTLMFRQMRCADEPIPEHLPDIHDLAQSPRCLYLASRNQLLLELARHRCFAFDIDNEGKQVRLVGNFKGGGRTPRPNEAPCLAVETSSHAGLYLGPHTKAPYNCSTIARNGHSPAPSALILTARWNPANEPTHVVPLREVIECLSSLDTLALTSRCFDFTRSDCFAKGKGNAGKEVSILQFEPNGGFSIRYNSYRFRLSDRACSAAARAFTTFQKKLDNAQPLAFVLQPDSALLINNSRALHGRDRVQDNRRLLIPQFGYSPFAEPLVLVEDPLLVRG
ncbi:hypothetical protein [Pseudomonas putida]|uniref:TauD/TfdA-like domain-containing protein n=1 Tax=Pseudomonas putida TaxID=303 RepID=A0A1L7N6L7_PSEPU|nr:hypothetical protein [Pseudomonas putida]KAF0253057.1 hypothetical protein GN299_20170 [Pseudomonas putida]MBH3416052.1 hypothetical protein [Pseudomonas putida]MCE0880535.1 hypothetical protein [Pseudomonas putida]MDD1990194.1 hypothetical protein [Pseudomonas putida]MDG9814409.1 hypothetical protein [Pseudomonas putida]